MILQFPFEFVANEHKYRTNADASVVEYQLPNSTRWVRTKYLTPRQLAVNALKKAREIA